MKIIDFRCRPLTKEWLEFLEHPFQKLHAGRSAALRGGKFQLQTLPEFIKEMDDAGVSIGVVLGRDCETTLGLKQENDKIAEMVSQYPDRLIGFAGVDPNKGMAAVREVDRAVKLGLKGISLDPTLAKLRMNDKKFYPIYTKCIEYGLPVSLTTGNTVWGNEWTYMGYADPMPVDEVATDLPELTIILSHAGFPWVWQTLAICRRHPQVYLELSGITGYPAMGADTPYIQAANSGLLAGQFLFGSAAPYLPVKWAVENTKKLPFKPEAMDRIFYANAARILKL